MNELVIIDTNVTNPQVLADDLKQGQTVRLIQPHENALSVIAESLKDLGAVSSLHIVSHGAPGRLYLAGDEINTGVLREREALVSSWSDYLTEADILIYGCETGLGAAGRDFLSMLGNLTGAHVAAAGTPVGRGVWHLDVQPNGHVGTRAVFSEALQQSYAGVFANVTFAIDPPFSVESTASSTTFRFTLDEAPAPGEFVSVWFYATTAPGGAAGDAITNEISQFFVFDLFDPTKVVGIPIGGVLESNGVPNYDPDASVLAGASTVPDFTVFELRLTQLENSITLSGFDDGANDGPRTVYWNVIDNPADAQTNSATNGSILFTEVDTPDELPPVNTAPDASDDTAFTAFDTPVEIDVLANDSDADDDVLEITSVSASAEGGTVEIDDNGTTDTSDDTVLYTPADGFDGEDSFTYVISDGNGGEDTATVTVTVDPEPNTDPVAENDSATTRPETAVEIDVLANDSDADGDDIRITSIGDASNGTVSIDDKGTGDTSDDTLIYTPDAGFDGNDSFTYEISDGNGGTDTAVVDVAVASPVVSISADKTTLIESENDAVTLTFNVENLPADGLRVSVGTYRPGDSDDDTLAFGIADFNFFPFPPPGATFSGLTPIGGWTGNDGFAFQISEAVATVTLPLNPDDPDRAPGDPGFTRNNDVGVEQVEWRIVDFARLNPGLPGPDEYQIADGAGSVILTLKDTPDQTFEASDDLAITAGRPVEIDVLANDAGGVEIVSVEDRDVSTQGLLQNGTVVIDDKGTSDTSDDTLVYTPDDGFTGRETFAYLVRNADGQLDQARVQVEVSEFSNGDPIATDDSDSTDEDTPVTIGVLGNDSDPDDDSLTITSIGSASNGDVVNNGDGTVTYTPDEDFNGLDSFTYTISDGNGGSDMATVTVSVAPGNDDPVANDDSDSTSEDTPVTINLLSNDSDPDGDDLTIASVGSASNGSVVDNGDGTVTYTPDANFNGSDSFTYTVSDGNGGTSSATVSLTISAVNDDPQANDDEASTEFNTPVTISVLGNDIDVEGDTLTVTSFSAPNRGGLVEIDDNDTADTSDDVLVYTPLNGFSGQEMFTYLVSDGNGGEDTATVTVTVSDDPNQPPQAVDDEGSTLAGEAVKIAVIANDSDPDGDALTIVSVADPDNGTATFDASGVITYTPDEGFTGTEEFTYTVSDGRGGESSATVSVTVNERPNRAPVAVDDDFTAFALPPGAVFEGNFNDPLFNDTDPDGDELTITGIGDFVNLDVVVDDGGTPDDSSDDLVEITLNNDDGGTEASYSYTISDGRGGTDTARVIFALDIPANTDPDAQDDVALVLENRSSVINVLGNDTDADGDLLTITMLSDPANGTVEDNGDGTVTYTPDAGYTGPDSFSYEVSDGNGGVDSASVDLTVAEEVIPDPVKVTFSVAENQIILDEETQQSWSFEVEGDIPSTGVAVWLYADQPGADFVSRAPLFPDAVDGDIVPQAINQYNLFALGLPGSVEGIDFSVANSDASALTGLLEFPDFSVFQVLLTENAGTISLPAFNDDLSIFVEGESFDLTAPYSVVWKVADAPIIADDASPASSGGRPDNLVVDVEFEGSPEVTVYKTASDVVENSDPDAVSEGYSVAPGATLVVNAATGVLANDTDSDEDPLTAFILENPKNGALTLMSDGSFEYTPDEGFEGEDSFTYLVRDDAFGSSVATATIVVEVPNGAPDAVDDAAETVTNTPVTVDVLANDTDPEEDPLSITDVGSASNGMVEDNGDGTLTYTPDEGFTGSDSFTYTIADGEGGEDTATVNVTIEEPPLPVVGISSVTTELVEEPGVDRLTLNFNVQDLPAEGLVVSIGLYRPGDSGEDLIQWGLGDLGLFGVFADGMFVRPEFTNAAPVGGWQGNSGVTLRITGENASVTFPIDPDATDAAPGAAGDTRNTDVGIEDIIFRLVDFDRLNPGLPETDAYAIDESAGEVQVKIRDTAENTYQAGEDVATTAGRAIEIDVLANDNGGVEIVSVEGPPGGSLALQNGTVAIDDKGTEDTTDDVLVYTPNAGFVGREDFAYLVRNADGEVDQAEVRVAVTELVNEAPLFAATGPFELPENSTAVGAVSAEDADGDTIVYSLADTGDGALFEIDSSTGEIAFRTAPDFENPQDAGGDNVYNLTVVAFDGFEESAADATVTVTDIDEDPDVIEILGTEGRDVLTGTETDEVFVSLGGSLDRATGGGGADTFVFGAELSNGVRERDVITDFDASDDVIVLETDSFSLRDTRLGVLITHGADKDQIFVNGAVDSDSIVISIGDDDLILI
ncbi:MAG: Ig-like domain-containing protein [Pseudomonadota bacterium]